MRQKKCVGNFFHGKHYYLIISLCDCSPIFPCIILIFIATWKLNHGKIKNYNKVVKNKSSFTLKYLKYTMSIFCEILNNSFIFIFLGGPYYASVTVDRSADRHVTTRPTAEHSYPERTDLKECCSVNHDICVSMCSLNCDFTQ